MQKVEQAIKKVARESHPDNIKYYESILHSLVPPIQKSLEMLPLKEVEGILRHLLFIRATEWKRGWEDGKGWGGIKGA